MENQELNYEQSYSQLQDIINNMENGNMQVDMLNDNIKKASDLITICKNKLHTIEVDVNKLIADIEKNNIQ